jgi:hypothetical protein
MKASNQQDHDCDGHADADSAKTQLGEQGCELPGAGSISGRGNGRQHVCHG